MTQGLIGVLIGALISLVTAALTLVVQWQQKSREQSLAWAGRRAEELYNPLMEMATREMLVSDFEDGGSTLDYTAWLAMFTEELRPLVYRKAHLASPRLIAAVRDLRVTVEHMKVVRDQEEDASDDSEWLDRRIEALRDVIVADFEAIRRQLWPPAAR